MACSLLYRTLCPPLPCPLFSFLPLCFQSLNLCPVTRFSHSLQSLASASATRPPPASSSSFALGRQQQHLQPILSVLPLRHALTSLHKTAVVPAHLSTSSPLRSSSCARQGPSISSTKWTTCANTMFLLALKIYLTITFHTWVLTFLFTFLLLHPSSPNHIT